MIGGGSCSYVGGNVYRIGDADAAHSLSLSLRSLAPLAQLVNFQMRQGNNPTQRALRARWGSLALM